MKITLTLIALIIILSSCSVSGYGQLGNGPVYIMGDQRAIPNLPRSQQPPITRVTTIERQSRQMAQVNPLVVELQSGERILVRNEVTGFINSRAVVCQFGVPWFQTIGPRQFAVCP